MNLENTLDLLVAEIKAAQLWEQAPPSAEKLMSTEPFCVDTLTFEQWLQWVFIEKLRQLIAQPGFAGLPNRSDIHAMAEYAFKDYQQDTSGICCAIQQVDSALNAYHH